MKLMVLDGNSLVNRAFFGIKLLTTKDGRYTNASTASKIYCSTWLAAHKPDAVAIAWDERAPTFRHTAYDGYKATRHGMPEELAQQMPVLKELLTDLGFVQVSKAGWEPTIFSARWPQRARPRAAQRCWLPVTATACSLWTMQPPCCWQPTKRPSPWTLPPSARSTASSRRSSSTSRA